MVESEDTTGDKKPFEYKIPELPARATEKTGGTKQSKEGGKNLWQSILGEVVKRDDLEDSHVLMLGDRGSGKRSIIKEINAKYILARNKEITVDKMGSDFSALDFSFLYVKDLMDQENLHSVVTIDDNCPKLNIWSLHDSSKCDLLEAVIEPDDLQRTVAVIVLDLDNPLKMMQSLRDWLQAINKTLFNIFPQMSEGTFEKMKQKIQRIAQTYEEPQLDEHGNLIKTTKEIGKDEGDSDLSEDDVRLDMELGEGVLQVNLGIPIIVVCNKVDILQQGTKSKLILENIDFIQKNIREQALMYSSTVIFTSSKAKVSRNLDTLYQYMLHRLYEGYDFAVKPQIIEKDQLFIPSGFDSKNLIDELCRGNMMIQNQDGTLMSYEEVLGPQFDELNQKKLTGRAAAAAQQAQEKLFTCEDWQSLLQKKYREQNDGQSSKPQLAQNDSKPQPPSVTESMVATKRQSLKLNPAAATGGVSQSHADPNVLSSYMPNKQQKNAQSGKAYFNKLLNNQKAQKQRQSVQIASEQANSLADKLQGAMDEKKPAAGDKKNETEKVNEESSLDSDDSDEAPPNANQTKPAGDEQLEAVNADKKD